MRNTTALVLTLALSGALVAGSEWPRCEQGPEGSRLLHTIELTTSQSGFAGITGTRITLHPDGRFEMADFLNRVARGPVQEGQLSPQALAQVTDTLRSFGAGDIPETIEDYKGVNPSSLSIRLGDKVSHWSLPPGTDIRDLSALDHAPDDPRSRLRAIALELREKVARAVDDP
jgi:hypothetical protein